LIYNIPEFHVIPTDYNFSEKYTEIFSNDSLYAVRSSSPYEDGVNATLPGVFDSFLNVKQEKIEEAVDKVLKSAKSKRAISQAHKEGVDLEGKDKMAVIVQDMVKAEISGYMESTLPEDPTKTSVTYTYGLADSLNSDYHSGWYMELDKITNYVSFKPDNMKPFDNERYRMGKLSELVNILEDDLQKPIEIEFALEEKDRDKYETNLVQLRTINKKFSEIPTFPETDRPNLIKNVMLCRGVGEFKGPLMIITEKPDRDVYVSEDIDSAEVNPRFKNLVNIPAKQIKEQDEKWKDTGYALITSHIMRTAQSGKNLDDLTPNKKVIIETRRGMYNVHALTLARNSGILYINADWNEMMPIQDGDEFHIVSDGREAHAYWMGNERQTGIEKAIYDHQTEILKSYINKERSLQDIVYDLCIQQMLCTTRTCIENIFSEHSIEVSEKELDRLDYWDEPKFEEEWDRRNEEHSKMIHNRYKSKNK